MPNATGKARAYLLLAVMPLFFSSNLVIGRAAVESVGPWTLAFLRWSIAGSILLPFAYAALRAHAADIRANGRQILLLGFLGMWICGGGVYMSLQATTATNGTLIYGTSTVFVLLIEAMRGRPVQPRQVLGIGAAMLGIAVIVLRADLARLWALSFNWGDLGILFAAFSWAVYSVALKAAPLQRIPTLPLFTAIIFAGALLLAPVMLWEVATIGPPPPTVQAWSSILGLATVSSILAFGLYQIGVKTVGPTLTSVFLYLLPPYGVTLAVVFLGETFQTYHLWGMLLVVAGVVTATLPASLLTRGAPASGT